MQDKIFNFISKNDDLEKLKSKLNMFNPFKILNIKDKEHRHSDMLAWLFNPNENHNFDDKILKRYLIKTILKPENAEVTNHPLNSYALQKMLLIDCKVYREKDYIDLLIISEYNQLAVIIENKIGTNEHSEQLTRYLNIVRNKYNSYTIIPIYLTIDGNDPSNNNYYASTYSDVVEVLEFTLVQNYDLTSKQVINFIKYYNGVLKEKLFMDETIKELCKKLYEENQEIIDLIYPYSVII